MKISKIFHSLYFMVMFLPLFIIPIFAININQKSVEPISIEVQEKVAVDFNQLDNVNTKTDSTTRDSSNYANSGYMTYNFNQYEKYIFRFDLVLSENCVFKIRYPNNNTFVYQSGSYSYEFTYSGNQAIMFQFYSTNGNTATFTVEDGNLFNTTTMFGSGNEPTIQEFNSMFPYYYPYTESQKMLVNKPNLTTYDNTDIGSQFLYSLYKPVHDYFNFGQYFGLNGVYDWFQVNWFNGTAPLTFFIFYNLMIYWLIISLLWLLFDVLIYVPLLIHRWLDKAAIE